MQQLTILKILAIGVMAALAMLGCDSSPGKKKKGLLPSATGQAGEMILVMDSAKWKGPLGSALRATFQSALEGLPREEPYFSLRYVDPRKLNPVLKRVKNILFVATFDSNSRGSRILKGYFTPNSLERIKSDTSLFVYTANDEFAKGQSVMYLFGQQEDNLIRHIERNRSRLVGHFNKVENDRLFASMYKSKEVKGIDKMLRDEHQCSMRLPYPYQLVENKKNFVWIRHADVDADKNLIISHRPYTTPSVFARDSLVLLRNAIARKHLFDDPANPESFVVTEPAVPVFAREVTFGGKFAVEARGLWKTNNISMGGPFLGYCFVDEALNRLYYIEGFLYRPGKTHREAMRELETILNTFKTSGGF